MRVKQFNEFLSKHKLTTILSIGILIRIVLIPISAHPFDVYAWYHISNNILQNGPLTLSNFPPLWPHYIMIPIAYTYSWLAGIFQTSAIAMSSLPSGLNFYPSFDIQYVPGWLFNTIVKFPFLLSDIFVTLLLYKIINELRHKKELAEKAAILWFLNPFVIWISAVWGTWDTLAVLFTLSAFYFILKKRYSYSAIFISLGVACKLYPLLFLIPILIFIQKTTPVERRLKESLTFISVFLLLTTLLFLPYLGTIASFFTSYFVPTSQVSALAGNPIDNPLGFGLTYWALYLLNRILNFSISGVVISYASIFSIILSAALVSISYWKIGKINFKNSLSNLVLLMFLPIVALFLAYRIICEQFFIWLIPFIIILVISDRIKPIFYYTLSLIALLYALLNCPIPFFFLPLAQFDSNALLNIANFMLSCETLRILLLAFLGCIFSILLAILAYSSYKKR